MLAEFPKRFHHALFGGFLLAAVGDIARVMKIEHLTVALKKSGFVIKGVDVRWPAHHEKKNNRFGSRLEIWFPRSEWIERVDAADLALRLRLQQPVTTAEKERALVMEKARQEQEELLARARRELAEERQRAVTELRREAVDLSLAAAGRLIRQRLDSDADRQLVHDYLATLEPQH